MKISYELSEKESAAAKQFLQEQDELWLSRQKASGSKRDRPYFGAIGGSVSWIIIPTSIGTIIKVKHATGEERDITDYNQW